MAPRRPHREFAPNSSHWRRDGQPKVRYRTRTDALSAAEERSGESETRLNVYHCPFCEGWHMGRRSDAD